MKRQTLSNRDVLVKFPLLNGGWRVWVMSGAILGALSVAAVLFRGHIESIPGRVLYGAGILVLAVGYHAVGCARIKLADDFLIVYLHGWLGRRVWIRYSEILRVETDVGLTPMLKVFHGDNQVLVIGPWPEGFRRRCRRLVVEAAALIEKRLP